MKCLYISKIAASPSQTFLPADVKRVKMEQVSSQSEIRIEYIESDPLGMSSRYPSYLIHIRNAVLIHSVLFVQ